MKLSMVEWPFRLDCRVSRETENLDVSRETENLDVSRETGQVAFFPKSRVSRETRNLTPNIALCAPRERNPSFERAELRRRGISPRQQKSVRGQAPQTAAQIAVAHSPGDYPI